MLVGGGEAIRAASVAEASIHSRQAIFLCLFPALACCWGNYRHFIFSAASPEGFKKQKIIFYSELSWSAVLISRSCIYNS